MKRLGIRIPTSNVRRMAAAARESAVLTARAEENARVAIEKMDRAARAGWGKQ